MRILIALPSAETADGELSLAAVAAPYFLLRDGGIEVALASPAGGYPAVGHGRAADGAPDPAVLRFARDRRAREELADTLRLDQVCAADFAGLLVAGGPAALVDLATDPALAQIVAELVRMERPVAFLAHGRAALGAALVRGRRICGAGAEGAALDSALAGLGARIERPATGIVRDGLLLTAGGEAAARSLAHMLRESLA